MQKCKKAFSLVELLVVIAIIGIMTGIVVFSLNPERASAKLNAAGREVASSIKLAQSYALQGKLAGGGVACGYGVNIKDDVTYVIFYLTSSDCKSFNQGIINYTDAPQLEEYKLKDGVKFSADLIDKKIYFTVPHGVIFGSDGNLLGADMRIQLNFSDKQKFVTASPGGTVTESD